MLTGFLALSARGSCHPGPLARGSNLGGSRWMARTDLSDFQGAQCSACTYTGSIADFSKAIRTHNAFMGGSDGR